MQSLGGRTTHFNTQLAEKSHGHMDDRLDLNRFCTGLIVQTIARWSTVTWVEFTKITMTCDILQVLNVCVMATDLLFQLCHEHTKLNYEQFEILYIFWYSASCQCHLILPTWSYSFPEPSDANMWLKSHPLVIPREIEFCNSGFPPYILVVFSWYDAGCWKLTLQIPGCSWPSLSYRGPQSIRETSLSHQLFSVWRLALSSKF